MITVPCKTTTAPTVIHFQDWGDTVNMTMWLVDSQSLDTTGYFATFRHLYLF